MTPPPPDYSRNFLPMPRPVLRELWKRPVDLAVYAVLCDRAAWSAGPREIKGRMVYLDVGQAVCGRPDLALATGASDRAIRTALNRLQTDQLILLEPSKQGTKVTLCGLKESRAPREADRPTLDEPTVQRTVQRDDPGPSNEATTTQISEDQKELSLAPARAMPGTTDPAPEPEQQPHGWTAGAGDLLERATALGVDVGDELGALDDTPDFHPGLDTLSRQRLWLRRAIDYAKKHPKPPPSADRGEPRKGPRSALHEQPGRQSELSNIARQEAEAERQRLRDQAASTPPAEERSRMLRELLSGMPLDQADEAQEGAA